MSIDAQIDVAKHLLPLSFPKRLLLEPYFHQGNGLRFTHGRRDAPSTRLSISNRLKTDFLNVNMLSLSNRMLVRHHFLHH